MKVPSSIVVKVLSDVFVQSTRQDATEDDLSRMSRTANEVIALLNDRQPERSDRVAVLSLILLKMFGVEPDDIGPAPS